MNKFLALLLLIGSMSLIAQPLPYQSPEKHEGVATCASSVCHGSFTPHKDSRILHNEFITWSRHDRHAKAYETLLSEESRAIANKLGLKNAHEAKVCLDCHADNVPRSKRGEKFQLNDGVGCEACHGGSENWLKSHTNKNIAHEDNIANGMYPTAHPATQATLCLSCHYGNRDKFATHDIMGAGHPRLSFELDTFNALEPRHYAIDEDYETRKMAYDMVKIWAIGLITAAKQQLNTIQYFSKQHDSLFPEIALFDCHACHHSMSNIRWNQRKFLGQTQSGQIRLNLGNVILTTSITKILNPTGHQQFVNSIQSLNQSSDKKWTTALTTIQQLESQLKKLESQVIQHTFTEADTKALLKSVLELANKQALEDYIQAEQATMAIDVLINALGKSNRVKTFIDQMYALVEDEDTFKGEAYQKHLLQLLSSFWLL